MNLFLLNNSKTSVKKESKKDNVSVKSKMYYIHVGSYSKYKPKKSYWSTILIGSPIGLLIMTLFAVSMIPQRVRQIRTSNNWFEKIWLSIVMFIYFAFSSCCSGLHSLCLGLYYPKQFKNPPSRFVEEGNLHSSSWN